MSYCPECGEKIANDDVFCPFCGISLRSIMPVDDASMSETIVGMLPPAPSAAEPSNLKTENSAPQIGSEISSVVEVNQPAVETVDHAGGDTSENWAMKTESVEIPAAALEKEPEIFTPVLNAEDLPRQSSETEIPAPPTPLALENPPIPITSGDEQELGAAPTPTIIQEQSASTDLPAALSENQFGESESLPAPVEYEEVPQFSPDESETFEPPRETSDESLETTDQQVAFDTPPAGSPAGSDPTNESEQTSAEADDDDWGDESFETPDRSAGVSADRMPVESEVPIAVPEKPLVLENEETLSRFDSVQIFQKNEIQEELSTPAASAPASIDEPAPVVEPRLESKEVRSSTTPNIGNNETDGRKSAKLKPLEEGTILNNRYEIVRKIGGGGMGAVYLANDRNLGGVLRAVKEMVQSYIESEQQDKAINDFKRESLLLTSLDHPAIPTIYDYFFDEKEARFYLVMKYISGGDLASRLRAAPEGRIDEKSVTEWAIQVADVLDYLHNHEPSIVYRDLKPANVMIDGNSGRVMLIDFGIARWVNKEEKGVTAVGTMGYAPPELFSGNVEPRSDIYSLGSTMFHLLTGADPQSNPLLIFDFQKHPRPRQINSQLSDQIEQILMRSVEYNAEARFRSAAELRDTLKDHYNNLLMGKVTFGVKVAPSSRAFSEQAVFCGFCGKQIVATDVFCAFCGAQQPIAQQHVGGQPSVAVHPPTAKLVIMGTGELEPSSFRLEKNDNLLGRRDPMSNIFPEVDLSKYDPQTKISRRHARIWREGNSFLVEDLGSSNGTTLMPPMTDAVRLLPHQPRTLTNGDKIRLGDTTLHFTIG